MCNQREINRRYEQFLLNPRRHENSFYKLCQQCGSSFGEWYINGLYYPPRMKSEAIEELGGIIDEVLTSMLRLSGPHRNFAGFFSLMLKNRITDYCRRIERHCVGRTQDEQLARAWGVQDVQGEDAFVQGVGLVPDPNTDVANHVFRQMITSAVREVIRTLPPQQRRVATLAFLEGWTSNEISIELGITENTVGVHRSKAKGKILSEMRRRGYGPDGRQTI